MKDQPAYQKGGYLISSEQETGFGGSMTHHLPEHIAERAVAVRNKNSFFRKSVLWQFDSLTLISSIPTLLSIWKFPPSSLNKDQRNSWEWKDGLRGDEYKLKLDGSWVKAGEDLIPQRTPWKPLTLSIAPKVGDGTRCPFPRGDLKSALTVSNWGLRKQVMSTQLWRLTYHARKPNL